MNQEEQQLSRIRPNTFQCPNALVDDNIMATLTGNETKCYLVIVRKTLGWHKDADRISKSQIMASTGLGEAATDACMEMLVSFGLVKRLAENNPKVNHGVLWALETDDNKVNWAALGARVNALAGKAKAQTEKARKVRGGGVVEQPQVVEHTRGGVVEQPPQKPLSKESTTTTTAAAEKPDLKRYPTNLPEAEQNPLIRVFREVSGVFPGQSHWVNIVDAIRLIGKTHNIRDQDGLKEYLTPYWLAWSTRTGQDGEAYSKLNPTWLIEWAVGGQIPAMKQRGQNDSKLSNQKRSSTGQNGKANGGASTAPPSEHSVSVAERINARKVAATG